jgi:hypothetical protein
MQGKCSASLVLGNFLFFLVGLGLYACKAGTHKAGAVLLEPHLQSILLWLFWRWGLEDFFAWAGPLNYDPPNLSLPSSWDCRRELPASG